MTHVTENIIISIILLLNGCQFISLLNLDLDWDACSTYRSKRWLILLSELVIVCGLLILSGVLK
jgi:hypothetical protein